MSAFGAAVRENLAAPEMERAADSVKSLVSAELSKADPSMRVHKTAYFNHSYVPDLVMTWDGKDREVYLRFDTSPPRLREDADRLGTSGPVFFDLLRDEPATAERMDGGHGSDPSPAPSTSTLDNLSVGTAMEQVFRAHPRVLLTHPGATEAIRPATAQNMVERMVVEHLLRSGRGALGQTKAKHVIQTARDGFNAAVEVSREGVAKTLAVVRDVLQPEVETRIERSMQLLWWIGGGEPTAFPSVFVDDVQLEPADTRQFLQYLFREQHLVASEAFWDRLARRLSFDSLVGAGPVVANRNLDALMKRLAERIQLSHAAVDRVERQLFPGPKFAWSIDDNFIVLTGADFVCRLTPHGNRFSQRRGLGRSVARAGTAQRTAPYRVVEAVLEEEARRIRFERKASDIAEQVPSTLDELTKGFSESALLREVALQTGGSEVRVDFDRMIVGAEPDASIRDLSLVATRCLVPLRADEDLALQEFLDAAAEVDLPAPEDVASSQLDNGEVNVDNPE